MYITLCSNWDESDNMFHFSEKVTKIRKFETKVEVTAMWQFGFIIFADSISESNPRVIDDTRARKCATDLKRCSYYETCATYGLNVERVFQDGMFLMHNQQFQTDYTVKTHGLRR